MPKVRLDPLEEKREIVLAILKGSMAVTGKGREDVGRRIAKTGRTVSNRFADPGELTLRELWLLTPFLHLSDRQLLEIAKGTPIKEEGLT